MVESRRRHSMSTVGYVPSSGFAMFAAGRAFEQIRNSSAAPTWNVKIATTPAWYCRRGRRVRTSAARTSPDAHPASSMWISLSR